MKKSQQGAALLLFLVVMVSALAVTLSIEARHGGLRLQASHSERQNLALAANALKADAFARRCRNRALQPADLLPCPDGAGTEGVAAASCATIARGWLPWKTLGLPPLRDSSGTCLWYERQGATARVIAAGGAGPGQSRATAAGRVICRGNLSVANYVDAADPAVQLVLDATALTTRCP